MLDIRPAGERNAPRWLQRPFPPPLPPPLQCWTLCSSQPLPIGTGTLQNTPSPALYWPRWAMTAVIWWLNSKRQTGVILHLSWVSPLRPGSAEALWCPRRSPMSSGSSRSDQQEDWSSRPHYTPRSDQIKRPPNSRFNRVYEGICWYSPFNSLSGDRAYLVIKSMKVWCVPSLSVQPSGCI